MIDLRKNLNQFTGSDTFYRHPLNRKATFTEGIQYLAEHAGAYWLVDDIIVAYQFDPAISGLAFQVWILTLDEAGSGATLRVEDGDKKHIKTYDIAFTDFPLKTIMLWFINETLLLPSEY